ncbi:hypothetical protein QBC34DRAFT_413384 [Podospora aff. communis PSN243]|uniref:Ankyrin n=1 Tax=Podospora aff. communis PSN243 TaxID=3040156 RepID=A0AAV9GA74_9PEZI|nr:hypothetical protein QBC34DRAFT_413384 [Podospora aff. communis PSN243]
MRRVLGLDESSECSPLFLASFYGFLGLMENFLSIGADVEFESEFQRGTPIMGAAAGGKLEAVKLLVRRGTRVMYTSTLNGRTYSAVVEAARFPGVVRWLLVGRYVEQLKIGGAGTTYGEDNQKVNIRPWSGLTRAGLPLVRDRKRLPWDSSLEWLERLGELRETLRGGAVFSDVELLWTADASGQLEEGG